MELLWVNIKFHSKASTPKKPGLWKFGFGLSTKDHVSQCGCEVLSPHL